MADLESRTKFNFTDEGRIELAKQYMIGPAKEVLESALLINGYDWEGVKEKIQEIYAEEYDFIKYRKALYSAKRRQGETIREFYVRTDLLMQNLIKMDPDCTVYVNQDQIETFKAALPPAFESCLSGSKRKIPAEVYRCAIRFIRNNPQYKLTDEDLRKEVKQTVNMAMSTTSPTKTKPEEKKENRITSSIKCYNCQGLGHIARHCRKKGTRCENCGLNNHRTRDCRRAPRRQCMNCGLNNHYTIDCRRTRYQPEQQQKKNYNFKTK